MKTLEEQTAEVLALDDKVKQLYPAYDEIMDLVEYYDNTNYLEYHSALENLGDQAEIACALLRQWRTRCEKLEQREIKEHHAATITRNQCTDLQEKLDIGDKFKEAIRKQNTALQQRLERMRGALQNEQEFREICRNADPRIEEFKKYRAVDKETKQALADDSPAEAAKWAGCAVLLDPDMPAQELRLHMGEITAQEERTARAAIRWANSRISATEAEK